MFRLVILCIEPVRLKLLPKNKNNYNVRQQVCNFSVLTKSSLSALAKVIKLTALFSSLILVKRTQQFSVILNAR